ncbi:toll/interleukin-1 receptor domain-containing protein [Streptomyces sp. NPDC002265]|uniref:toll/interleukin-1 receptor domain-containing protein n=1 Tax=Streptomyces sp. NPDC002265 TaxID=3154415 RepID=UPI00331E4672
MGDVFISHSAKGDTLAAAVLCSIEKGLRERGHTPRLDQTGLPPGTEWHPEIVDWLARCDAAVVLLNDKALKSHWVRREVNILMWRRALGAPLLIVPVLVGDLGTGAVKQAGLEELRPIQFARTGQGEPHDAQALADQVLDQFTHLPEQATREDPMSAWLEQLGQYLAEARNNPGMLAKAARILQIDSVHLPEIDSGSGGCLFLAHQFLVAPPARMEQALKALAPSLQDQTIRRLVAALTATWVSEEAARKVLPSPGERPHEMTLLLNARKRETAEDYIRRATCDDHLGFETRSVETLPTGEDRVGERFRSWEDAVWKEFFDADTVEDRWYPDDLETRTHYLVIKDRHPPDMAVAEAVGLLHGEFSWLIVLVLTGVAPPDPQVQARFSNAVLLQPLLTASDEQTARLRNLRLRKLPELLAGTS